MKKIQIKQVDAFTKTPLKGNPAGIVLNAEGLTDEEMQLIAREMNLSETAFIMKSQTADFKVRFFTPVAEVDLCGHATIGTFYALAEENRIKLDVDYIVVTQETRAGILPVEIYSINGILQKIMMTQAKPQFRDISISPEEVAYILNIPSEQICRDFPLEMAYTGLWHLMVPIKNIEFVRSMNPNMKKLREMNLEYGIITTHVFCFETQEDDAQVHTRSFAPAVNVEEDPATGTANGALGAYLVKNKIFKPENGVLKITAEQGYEINRDSKIFVEVYTTEEEIEKVKVGGIAVTSLDGTLYLP